MLFFYKPKVAINWTNNTFFDFWILLFAVVLSHFSEHNFRNYKKYYIIVTDRVLGNAESVRGTDFICSGWLWSNIFSKIALRSLPWSVSVHASFLQKHRLHARNRNIIYSIGQLSKPHPIASTPLTEIKFLAAYNDLYSQFRKRRFKEPLKTYQRF